MDEIVRWITPAQLDEQNRPSPNAFPLRDIRESCRKLRRRCSHKALSLIDMGLLTPQNKAASANAVCRLCRGLHHHGHIRTKWQKPGACPCEHNISGVKGACANRNSFFSIGLNIQPAASKANPLHVLLCMDGDISTEIEALEIQFLLIEVFNTIRDVSDLLD